MDQLNSDSMMLFFVALVIALGMGGVGISIGFFLAKLQNEIKREQAYRRKRKYLTES